MVFVRVIIFDFVIFVYYRFCAFLDAVLWTRVDSAYLHKRFRFVLGQGRLLPFRSQLVQFSY